MPCGVSPPLLQEGIEHAHGPFLEHLNSINPKIQFTCEETREDGSMPFLDILVTPEDDGSLKTSVFRKTTHTDLYLQWDSPPYHSI